MKLALFLLIPVCLAASPLYAAPDAPSSATPAPAKHRLAFKAYDGDPNKSGQYEKFSFQIDTLDLKQPSEFLRLGDTIPNTHLKLSQFVFKTKRDPNKEDPVDVSELTVVNVITGKTAVLIFNKVVDVSAIDAGRNQADK